ncbi:MAG: RibD family protein [Omnitrophica bacterium]|nr:RibD family protein [Candidatus Omnitrophota bacterium]
MKRPYITLKFAQTLDGRIAARDGSSKWVSGTRSRELSHKLRAENDAILVGIRTVLADNPSLTVRHVKGKDPVRIILDSALRTPRASKVVKGAYRVKTIIACAGRKPGKKSALLEKKGVQIISCASKKGNVDLKKLVHILYKTGLRSILVEGGRGVITSFLAAGLADKIVAIISPKILGSGTESVGSLGINSMKGAVKLGFKSVRHLGDDVICRYNVIAAKV